MTAEEWFRLLEALENNIHQERQKAEKDCSKDIISVENGEMSMDDQKKLNKSRYASIKNMNIVFEQKFNDAISELFGPYLESNPFLESRLAKLKSTMANEADINTNGNSRVNQLRDLYNSIS